MMGAVMPHLPCFVTPMAAVAGAVADHVLAAMTRGTQLIKAHVNNGGDIAFHLENHAVLRAAEPASGAVIEIPRDSPWRGIATSGWRGRSQSMGIADAVTVLARTAAEADVAATLIANAVDVADHPGITRVPARERAPDSDLGDRLVTVGVEALTPGDIASALASGIRCAEAMLHRDPDRRGRDDPERRHPHHRFVSDTGRRANGLNSRSERRSPSSRRSITTAVLLRSCRAVGQQSWRWSATPSQAATIPTCNPRWMRSSRWAL